MNETQANKCTETRLHAAIVVEDGCWRAIIVRADMLEVNQANGAYQQLCEVRDASPGLHVAAKAARHNAARMGNN
ncbi:hypothetical protein PQR37_32125 [Paraburkholderia nemoris]|uniref:hypothetical protein n=1 Tax=Paraburkholderia nemoris TaxID=2793076 RepID=UPI001911ED49|nr:hypothetical protein [Paraburkholderia nemoris]MBK5151695.1 hypothetical protein [Burkholderia sp. R-69608]